MEPRSADFQSAVSRISNPPALRSSLPCRLEVGDTAGWKPALLPPYEMRVRCSGDGRTPVAVSRCALCPRRSKDALSKRRFHEHQQLNHERFGGNITAKMRSVKMDLLHCAISRIASLAQVFSPGGHTQDAAAVSDDPVARSGCAGVEHFDIGQSTGLFQSVDCFTFFVAA